MSDTKTLLVVSGGAAIDACVVPADAVVAKDGASATWGEETLSASSGTTYVDQPGAAIGWVVQGGGLVAPPPPPAPAAPTTPPDCPSLPWWRTALKLWTRTDATSGTAVTRYSDVDAAIKALETATNADGTANVPVQRAGILAREQFEYANSVLLADLLKLAPAFGFSAADCAESLWRANCVRQGDLSGNWPLPTSA